MRKISYLVYLSLFISFSVLAETAEEKGLAIAIEADKRDTGWLDRSAEMEMTLRNAKGDESKRFMRNKVLEVENDGDKSLTIFDQPRDVKGTSFLSFTHSVRPDDQWIHLPALKRVKRISSSNKSGPFMGSEFAYEDISSQEVDKYSYKFLRDEVIDGQDTFVIERKPSYKYSGYTRLVTWTDKETYQPLKIEYYDKKNTLLKTLTFDGYKQFIGQYWRAELMEMKNHQTGKSTTIEWKNYQFKNGLSKQDFNKNALKRLH